MVKNRIVYFSLILVVVFSAAWFLYEKVTINNKDEIVHEWYQVPELGIEFQVDKKVANELVYTYQSYPQKGIPSGSVFFSIKSLSANRPECAAGGAMVIHRFNGVPEDYSDSMVTSGRIKQFEGFFIELFGGLCASSEDYRKWALLFTGEDSQIDGWMIDDVLKTSRKTSRQTSITTQGNLLEIPRDNEDLVWYRVPELGVEFQIEKKVSEELIYSYSLYPKNGLKAVAFSSKQLANIPGCEAASGPLGALNELAGTPDRYEDKDFYNARNPKQFDSFFIFFDGPQAICASDGHVDEYNQFFEENNNFSGWSRDIFSSMRRIK